MSVRDSLRKWLFADQPTPQPAAPRPQGGALGASGVRFSAGVIDAGEFNKDLTGIRGADVFDRMRREAMVRSTLQLINLPIKSAHWDIECEDEEVKEFLVEALFRRIDWDQYLTHCLLAFPFGFEIMEKVWKLSGGKYWLEGIEHRRHNTIWEWMPDASTGALAGVKQRAWKGQSYSEFLIPRVPSPEEARMKLVHLAWDQEGNNFEGISGLRSAYPYWYGKTEVFKIAAMALERFGLGVPMATAPYDEETQQGRFTPDEKAAAIEIVKNMRAGSQAHIFNPGGWKFDVLGAGEQHRYDPMPFLQYCDEMIALNILAEALNLGRTTGGNRALGESQFGMFTMALEAIADLIRTRTEYWVIQPLVALNFANVDGLEIKLRWSDLEVKNKGAVAEYTSKLVEKGLIIPDEQLEDHLRAIGDLPPRPEQGVSQTANDRRRRVALKAPHVHGAECGHEKKLSISGLKPAYWRELTDLEKLMTLNEIKGRQDDGREQVARVFEEARPQWVASLKEQLRAAIADGEYSDLDQVEVPSKLVEPAHKEIISTLDDLYGYGRRTIKDELGRQKKKAATAPQGLPAREEGVDKQERRDLFWTRSGKYLRRLSRAVEEQAIERSLSIMRTQGPENFGDDDIEVIAEELLTSFDSTARLAAQVLVAEAFNLGRDDEAQEQGVEKAVYSAILDESTCQVCADVDGEEFQVGTPEYYENAPPNKECESTASGTNYCRCLYVYVFEGEQEARG